MVFDSNSDEAKAFSDTLDGLRERRRALEEEMRRRNREWRSELTRLDRAISALESLSDRSPEGVGTDKAISSKDGTLSKRLRNIAISELLAADRPLDRNELLNRILERGLQIDKKEPAKFLTRVLWRTKELVNEGDGYWIKSRPKPRG